jgi:predicted RNA-binding protein YlqC (UPF0109 family)
MKDLVEFMAKSLVDDPASVRVREVRSGHAGVVVELHVSAEDMGRIIGKSGRVANAMRSVLKVAAAKAGKRATLEIV